MERNGIVSLISAGMLFFFNLSILACKGDSVSDVERIVNSYKAIVLTLPGSRDEPVDVIAKGGMLTARLLSDYRVEGRIVIPPNISTSAPATDTNYVGSFTLSADTVRFRNTGTPLDHSDYFPFVVKGARLESVDKISRGPFNLKPA